MNAGAPGKQPTSIYTIMLVLSAILMTIASILMAVEAVRWGLWEDTGIPKINYVLPSDRGYYV